MGIEGGVAMAPPPPLDRQTHIMYFIDSCCPEEGLLGRGGGYWDIVTYIISQYLIPAILYRDIIYALYPSSTPSPPKNNSNLQGF